MKVNVFDEIFFCIKKFTPAKSIIILVRIYLGGQYD